jgi:hypothetical protein
MIPPSKRSGNVPSFVSLNSTVITPNLAGAVSDLNGFAVFGFGFGFGFGFVFGFAAANVAAAKAISTWIYFKIRTISRNVLELDDTNIHGRCCSFSAVLNCLYS